MINRRRFAPQETDPLACSPMWSARDKLQHNHINMGEQKDIEKR